MRKEAIDYDLYLMAKEELSRHYGIKNPDDGDVTSVIGLLKKMPMIQAVINAGRK